MAGESEMGNWKWERRDRSVADDSLGGRRLSVARPDPRATRRTREQQTSPSGSPSYFLFPVSNFSISSIARSILRIVRSSGSGLAMSTPASFSRSMGYFDPPAARKAR